MLGSFTRCDVTCLEFVHSFGTKVVCLAATGHLHLIGQGSRVKESTLLLLVVVHCTTN